MPRLPRPRAPRDEETFADFEAAAATALEAAELLDLMLEEHPDHPELPARIREVEHAGDRITRALTDRVNAAAPGRLDRADVLLLASTLDDVTDLVEEVADLFVLYRIEAPMQQAQELAHLLALACAELAAAMPLLRSSGDVGPHVAEVARLESEGDRVSRGAIATLFDAGIDPMVVIRWKDVFERLEDAVDATQRAAGALRAIQVRST